MSDQVNGAAGTTDDGLNNLCFQIDRSIIRSPALFGVSVAEKARGHDAKAICERRDQTAPSRTSAPRAGHEENGWPRSLLVVVDTSTRIFDHRGILLTIAVSC